ncbi:MAG: hypothetical protein WBB07_08035 [Mycobacterium sp.]
MRVLLAPLWARALYWTVLGAVIVALLAGVFTASSRPLVLDWPVGTASYIAVTAVFGAALTWRSQTSRLPYTAQVAGLTSEQRSAAIRATTGGPLPADAEVVKAALRLGTVYLDQHKANRRRNQVMTGVLVTIAIFLLIVAAYDGDVWGLVYPLVVLIVLPLTLWWTESKVSRTKRQNRELTQARRTQRKKRV